jgi:hypothetical protein
MKTSHRIAISVLLVILLILCAGGLVATLEPIDKSTELVFKLIYMAGMMVSLSALVITNRRKTDDKQ